MSRRTLISIFSALKTSKCAFTSCGFVHLNVMTADNASLHDGHHLLLASLRASVERDGDCSFIHNREDQKTSGYTTPALYKIRPKYYYAIKILDSSPSSTDKEGSGKGSEEKYFHWCDYQFRGHGSARLKEEDLKEAFQKAMYLKLWLPAPPPMMNQIPPASLCVRGEMLSSNRIQNTATTYMGTGEIEKMLALLLNDGRYDDAVSVVPLSYLEAITLAAEAHAEYEDAVVA